ncbi:hypothetical protein B0T26DRAFT_674347 [Lasiosphaeria miniovina]|uniref:Uncharacterized protein n=1 Tax=Lasiosphaeria miniovina TaxID=1954250 RepID=A0AA40AVA4_9PEZI|nr:uncharacterized protein B0T26DRAFT_674347 [Lasiosphaeria miniovina]KAK0722668.1 hypothetical protein B0T26DRAFT_674347 [Lasiosphaeria miniovina]
MAMAADLHCAARRQTGRLSAGPRSWKWDCLVVKLTLVTPPFIPAAYVAGQDPWGSSSGSAVGTALGFACEALGTEAEGSIVCTAERSNQCALKPTAGLAVFVLTKDVWVRFGLSFFGGLFSGEDLVRFAYVFEQATQVWRQRRPIYIPAAELPGANWREAV